MFQTIRVTGASTKTKPDVVVLGQFKGEGLDAQTRKADVEGAGAAAARRAEATGEVGSISEGHPSGKGKPGRVIVLGLGAKKSFEAGRLRGAAGALGRRLARTKDGNVALELSGALKAAKCDEAAAGSALGEGFGLVGWHFAHLQGTGRERSKPGKLSLRAGGALGKGLKRGLGLAESANIARSLSATPPNICSPYWLADEAQKMARKAGLKCRVIKGEQLAKEKLEGLINVGKASDHKPCLIRLEYQPKSPKKGARPIVLLGKTITYDCGGLSIKVGGGMRGMKQDKDGGCAVFGAMHAIATVIKPKVPVVGLMVAAENAISDEAYRPDDVLTFRNGVTVEVTNTDAEGRLVLADGLCWAESKEKPACIIDLATLTGGVVVALGSTYAGMWCDDEKLRGRIEEASAVSGERVWRLPHHQEYRDMMKSDVADIINSNPNRKAHPIQGAAFLSYFASEKTPWCHLDIAGVHAVDSESGPFVKDSPTGWGVRLLAELLARS